MPHPFVAQHRVEFFETDLAGIVHFANYYRFMEQAEHEFFRSLGLQIHGKSPDGTVFGWPRVAAKCSFKSPAYYGDVLDTRLRVVRLTRRSLTIVYEFQRDGQNLAEGEMKTAYCIIPTSEELQSAEMPDEYFDQLSKYLIADG
jgi:YbgC/YbaW family acyl-CoA thioester hydrolase